ncbi:MAG: peptide ABC transporter ATP-binding protein [Deltaproteobacteria bacterium]|nr:MAG: peptide ABC transporter ATP-binding protein [Deltaproteobacteria bacterium]RLC19235.1 MAG: peptide ABC transporter ATP-binding protein [Deltaproteobacteria bacterium]
MNAQNQQNILEIKDLALHFDTFEGTAKVLDGVSLSLERGDTLGVVGETGCGKSITAKAILGLLPTPPARIVGGQILFKGEDLLTKNQKEIGAVRGTRIAMIFQDPMTYLNPVFSIEKQMTDVIIRHSKQNKKPLNKKQARDKAVELLESVQIPSPAQRIGEYPHEFSGGMRQRVLIAMALSGDPELLIADEPTTALDVTIQAQILRLLKGLVNRLHLSILLISHDLGVVAKLCKRVAVMYAGNVVETSSIENIFNSPLHPYSKGLLNSIPKLKKRDATLEGIAGSIPSFITPPQGCRFAPRCTEAMELCQKVKPVLAQVEPGHSFACHLYPACRPADA